MSTRKPRWSWCDYDDVGHVLELEVLFDDVLKKDSRFLAYSVKLANRILEDQNIQGVVTWGKWGGRIDPESNPTLLTSEMEKAAETISKHPAWLALMESTRVFTYGRQDPDR